MPTVRYAALLRPPGPGAVPREGLTDCGYDEIRTPSGRHAWGWCIYGRELSPEEVEHYDLERIPNEEEEKKMKTWHIVDKRDGDEWTENTNTDDLDTARNLAISQWEALSDHDRKHRQEFYIALGETDEDGLLDWNSVMDTVDVMSAKSVRYQVELTDNETGATSPIDTITAKDGYTAEDYLTDCQKNADEDWCEMLNRGTVTITPIDD